MGPLRCTVCASLLALVLGGCGESRLTEQLTEEVRGGELSKAQKTVDELYGDDRDEADDLNVVVTRFLYAFYVLPPEISRDYHAKHHGKNV